MVNVFWFNLMLVTNCHFISYYFTLFSVCLMKIRRNRKNTHNPTWKNLILLTLHLLIIIVISVLGDLLTGFGSRTARVRLFASVVLLCVHSMSAFLVFSLSPTCRLFFFFFQSNFFSSMLPSHLQP